MPQTQKEAKNTPETTLPPADPSSLLAPPTPAHSLADLEEQPKRLAAKAVAENAGGDDELAERLKGGNWRLRAEKMKHKGPGLKFERFFTREGIHPYDEVVWERRSAKITNDRGEAIFEQKDLEFPNFWSQLATNVVVSKYFRGKMGAPTRETSLRDMIDRVVATIALWGRQSGRLRRRQRPPDLPGRNDLPAPAPDGLLQLAGLVQRGLGKISAVLGLLHQLRRRLDGLDPRPGQDGRHALQMGLRHRAPTSRPCAPRANT